jgi:hypothetical protein
MEINYLPYQEDIHYVDLEEGVQVPERLRAEVTDIGLPAVLEIEVAVREGAVTCERIGLRSVEGGPSITREMLRDLPVSQLASALMANSALISDFSHPGWGDLDTSKVFVVGGHSAPDDVYDSVRQRLAPRRRRRITNELLGTVAKIYRDHLDEGAPTRAVAEELMVSHSTAARYVAQARDRGLLGRTTPGLAGEREEQS